MYRSAPGVRVRGALAPVVTYPPWPWWGDHGPDAVATRSHLDTVRDGETYDGASATLFGRDRPRINRSSDASGDDADCIGGAAMLVAAPEAPACR